MLIYKGEIKMTSKNLIEIFNDDIEFNEQVFAQYTHIRRKFYGIEEFITAVTQLIE